MEIDVVAKTQKKEFKININSILAFLFSVIIMTLVMVIFNVLITPLYMNVPREVVIGMVGSVFIPFNAIKATINAILAISIYKAIHKFIEKNNYDK